MKIPSSKQSNNKKNNQKTTKTTRNFYDVLCEDLCIGIAFKLVLYPLIRRIKKICTKKWNNNFMTSSRRYVKQAHVLQVLTMHNKLLTHQYTLYLSSYLCYTLVNSICKTHSTKQKRNKWNKKENSTDNKNGGRKLYQANKIK